MTTSAGSTRKLAGLLKRLRPKFPSTGPIEPACGGTGECDIVEHLVYAMVLWEASSGQARAAFKRLRDTTVDLNELRVCVPEEIAGMLGERYPLAAERALRLRSVLHDVFVRQHRLTLALLRTMGKRDARAFLESLDGIPHFAAARVTLLALQGHAVPVDDRLRDLLAASGVVAPGVTAEQAAGWLERHVKGEDLAETCCLLQAWSDEEGHTPRRERADLMVPGVKPPSAPTGTSRTTEPAKGTRRKSGAGSRSGGTT